MRSKSKLSVRAALARSVAISVFLLGACSQILGLEDGKTQGACTSDAQCAPGNGCVLGTCRSGCSDDADCEPGSRCLKAIGVSACISGSESCGDACPDGTSCVQGGCRTSCANANDCAGSQACQGGLCIGTDAAHDDPMLEGAGGSGDMSEAGGGGGVPNETGMAGAVNAAGGMGGGGTGGYGPPTLGEPCETNAELACNGYAQKLRLLCDAGTWHSNGTCAAAQNCQESTGLCESIVPGCEDQAEGHHFCGANDVLESCGEDQVLSDVVEECSGKCVTLQNSAECAPSTCGDRKIQAPEECDDGNDVDTDACTSACKNAKCGDGAAWAGHEECDDGNDTTTDDCANCKDAKCGDSYVHAGVEECDDGNNVNTDSCIACVKATCGDGKVQAGVEECDDGNNVNTDACVACKNAKCGDKAVRTGVEECDDGNASSTDACVSCKSAYCGDSYVQAGVEACDHANAANTASCVTCNAVTCATASTNGTGAFWFTCSAAQAATTAGGALVAGTYHMTRRWMPGGGCTPEGGNKAFGVAIIYQDKGNWFMRFHRLSSPDASNPVDHVGTFWLQPGANGALTVTEVCDGPNIPHTESGSLQVVPGTAPVTQLRLTLANFQEYWDIE